MAVSTSIAVGSSLELRVGVAVDLGTLPTPFSTLEFDAMELESGVRVPGVEIDVVIGGERLMGGSSGVMTRFGFGGRGSPKRRPTSLLP